MIEIVYDGHGDTASPNFETMRLLATEPKRTLGVAAARGDYLKCTAVQDFHVNTFTVFSPFTVKFTFERDKQNVHIDGDNIINIAKYFDDGSAELQLFPQYVFRSKHADVDIQLLPPLLAPARSDAFTPPGEFNIHKWYRPLNTAFLIPPHVNELTIKEGEPLFSIRFVTPNNEPVTLVRQVLDENEMRLVKACANVTNVKKGIKLSKLYTYFEALKGTFKKPSKCPFHRS